MDGWCRYIGGIASQRHALRRGSGMERFPRRFAKISPTCGMRGLGDRSGVYVKPAPCWCGGCYMSVIAGRRGRGKLNLTLDPRLSALPELMLRFLHARHDESYILLWSANTGYFNMSTPTRCGGSGGGETRGRLLLGWVDVLRSVPAYPYDDSGTHRLKEIPV